MDPNFKYLLEKVDHLVDSNAEIQRLNNENQRLNSDKLEKILIQATKTNGRVTKLEENEEESKKDRKELREHIMALKEESHVNKGKAKIINMVIGAIGATLLILIEYTLKLFKIFK